jgi:hypothetical protein
MRRHPIRSVSEPDRLGGAAHVTPELHHDTRRRLGTAVRTRDRGRSSERQLDVIVYEPQQRLEVAVNEGHGRMREDAFPDLIPHGGDVGIRSFEA